MNGISKKMLVWPPIDKEEYGGWQACFASVSWFFGHLAESIVIPVWDTALDSSAPPTYAGAAFLHDAQRISVVPITKQDSNLKALFESADIVLCRKRDLSGTVPDIPLTRMKGSDAVQGIVAGTAAGSPSYYFIGSPGIDKQDAYYCVCFTYWLEGGEDKTFLAASREKLIALRSQATQQEKVGVFGTGPSVGEALEMDHSSNFNIICNTIVKNREFLDKLRPRIIVASDAHFHFSFHRYSSRFLSDLLHALDAYNAIFYTFDKFAAFIRRRVPELNGRVFGIPAGRTTYGYDLDQDYRVYPGESVLNMFLLPIASYLGNAVSLYGFTGRSPTDSYFWAHSDIHQYSDRMEDVRLAHPAFFANRDYPGYADEVDRQIATRVELASSLGKPIRSETTSFYSCFQ